MTYKASIKHNFIGINDSTLREGEQYNSSEFSTNTQKEILNQLYLIGVDTAEVGNPAVPEIKQDLLLLSQIVERPPLMAHIRNKESDLLTAMETGVEGVHMLCTVDPDRLTLMHTSLKQHIDNMTSNVWKAQEKGLAVRVSVEHGLERRFFANALKMLKVADSLGVDRVQVADTRGALLPWDVVDIVTVLRKEIRTEIGVHLHNDLGHATSNALQALAAGANWIDTTLLGIGERTGITPLSLFLINLYNIDKHISDRYALKLLTGTELALAKILSMKIPHNLITSPTAFSHKAGIHINGLERQGTDTYEAIGPEVVGNRRVIVKGSRISGKAQKA